MFDNNLFFSFILSLANTIMYYIFNTSKYENNINNTNQELLMIFGISFSICFFIKSISSGNSNNNSSIKGGVSNSKMDEISLSNSSRPPF